MKQKLLMAVPLALFALCLVLTPCQATTYQYAEVSGIHAGAGGSYFGSMVINVGCQYEGWQAYRVAGIVQDINETIAGYVVGTNDIDGDTLDRMWIRQNFTVGEEVSGVDNVSLCLYDWGYGVLFDLYIYELGEDGLWIHLSKSADCRPPIGSSPEWEEYALEDTLTFSMGTTYILLIHQLNASQYTFNSAVNNDADNYPQRALKAYTNASAWYNAEPDSYPFISLMLGANWVVSSPLATSLDLTIGGTTMDVEEDGSWNYSLTVPVYIIACSIEIFFSTNTTIQFNLNYTDTIYLRNIYIPPATFYDWLLESFFTWWPILAASLSILISLLALGTYMKRKKRVKPEDSTQKGITWAIGLTGLAIFSVLGYLDIVPYYLALGIFLIPMFSIALLLTISFGITWAASLIMYFAGKPTSVLLRQVARVGTLICAGLLIGIIIGGFT